MQKNLYTVRATRTQLRAIAQRVRMWKGNYLPGDEEQDILEELATIIDKAWRVKEGQSAP